MDIKDAIAQIVEGQSLSTEDMKAAMQTVMTGEATDAQIGALLIALRMKGESIDEITGAAQVMRDLSASVNVDAQHLVDTCGTGGDGSNLFNVSTASAFVVAAAGGSVAKHGNRSVSSSTGSADLLEAAGVNLGLSPEQVARAVQEIGVGFMFAPAHHSAMRHAIGPRKELAMRTIFNMLGPMTNPAGVKRQIIGVFSKALCRPMAEVLNRLGSEHVMVVHSDDGLDEISIAANTHVAELRDGEVIEYEIRPAALGIQEAALTDLSVDSAEQSLALIKSALGKDDGDIAQKARNIITINAAAAIYVSGLADSLKAGVSMAEDAIGSGLALAKMSELASFSQVFEED
ncbi:anthranilate phosphoribosyltransferase [Oleiphilus sp. HI0009]|uniref:anthranilate phosphoribosyltransferase n=1 Tax=Oleiphilus sp. HI0125 TaxID=1822266 RepID=UPI0007C2E0E9|nr:anthranilate phosphoribosyltransferase [Oleiphilus sp. HI0125]KZX76816.1 anthranilate phosphoribosyltransferase [Oleiphilus sp. HI0009]KZZ58183.1 anthranilate phosphoribosyltransferase [Oleiphilus sp. HI0125]KZZ58358.1 anthranilate phosphoribosyltransferase [Oleiphilus sp. HI0125]